MADMNIKVPINFKLQPRRHTGTVIFTSTNDVKKDRLLLIFLLLGFMTSIYYIISIETRPVTHFSGYKTITLHKKAMLYVLNHDFHFFAY